MRSEKMTNKDVLIRLLLSVLFAFPCAILVRSFAFTSKQLTFTEITVIVIMNALIFIVAMLHNQKVVFTKDEDSLTRVLNLGSYIVVALALAEFVYLFIKFLRG